MGTVLRDRRKRKPIHFLTKPEDQHCALCRKQVRSELGGPAFEAVCANLRTWETVYAKTGTFVRCCDEPELIPARKLKSFPAPTTRGFYWCKWRIAEDDTHEADKIEWPQDSLIIVEVFFAEHGDNDQPVFRADVPGYARTQSVENFIWYSGPIEPPKDE